MALKLHNTLSGTLEEFSPIELGSVKMYHCGPTVYGIQHIGNLSMFVFTDLLRRTLEYSDLEVKQVINITDFGHLTSDADEGEDKMTKGLKREGLEPTLGNMLSMGKKYAELWKEDLAKLSIETRGTEFPYASDYVPQQIEMIKKLEEKGFVYKTSDGMYFDISRFPAYGKLGHIKIDSSESRIGLNSEKKNPQDFAVWKFNEMGWEAPWSKGFPGWHIECSAMIQSILGDQIDIHTGGIEHIPVHHNNEIAQSESATGKSPFSRYWLHRAHLQIGGEKIAKSDGNVVYLSEIIEKGFSPLAFRYFLLNSTYRTPTNFTWGGLEAAQNALNKLTSFMSRMPLDTGEVDEAYKAKFVEKMDNDLNAPQALAILWPLVKDKEVSPENKKETILDFDKVLGLGL